MFFGLYHTKTNSLEFCFNVQPIRESLQNLGKLSKNKVLTLTWLLSQQRETSHNATKSLEGTCQKVITVQKKIEKLIIKLNVKSLMMVIQNNKTNTAL